MATISGLGTTGNTASGVKSATGTPTYGDLIAIITVHTGNTSSAPPTDDNTGSPGTYSEITACAAVKVSSGDQVRFWIRNNLIYSAISTVFTHDPGTSTGGGILVFAVGGLSRTGINAVRQGAHQDNQASGTPTLSFAAGLSSANALIGVVFNGVNPAGMTQPSGWTEDQDIGYGSPATGIELVHINSGATGSSLTWGSSSSTPFCAAACEFDCSAELQTELILAPLTPPFILR